MSHYDNEFVKRHLVKIGGYLASTGPEHVLRRTVEQDSWKQPESPLEAAFALWWSVLEMVMAPHQLPMLMRQFETKCGDQTYRLDFAIHKPGAKSRAVTAGIAVSELDGLGIREPLIAVEVDGHEFHERTKEQVAYRNRRDRELLQAGWKVLHVSGSEFDADPMHCVAHVNVVASQAYGEFYDAIHAEFKRRLPKGEV